MVACPSPNRSPRFTKKLDMMPNVPRQSYTSSSRKNCSTHGRWLEKREPPAGLPHCLFLPMVSSYLRCVSRRPLPAVWLAGPAPTHTCVCGAAMEIEHALSCRYGGLPIRRHNEICNLLASCLRKAGCDTAIEPQLQPLSGEVFLRQTTTTDQEARLDIKANGFFFLGGRGPRKHFLMSGCSTRSRPRTAPCQFPPFMRDTRRRSETATKNASAKSRGQHLCHWCLRQQVEPKSSQLRS